MTRRCSSDCIPWPSLTLQHKSTASSSLISCLYNCTSDPTPWRREATHPFSSFPCLEFPLGSSEQALEHFSRSSSLYSFLAALSARSFWVTAQAAVLSKLAAGVTSASLAVAAALHVPLWFCLACPIVLGLLAPFAFNLGKPGRQYYRNTCDLPWTILFHKQIL